MITWVLLAWLAMAGHFWQSPTEAAQVSSTRDAHVGSERRMFAVASRHAWDRIRQHLAELGFRPDKVDGANQLVLTKWRDAGAKGMDWLPAPLVPPYVGRRMRYEVFVSPFAEPAHVYVGSLVETEPFSSSGTTPPGPRYRGYGLVYNRTNVNRALMGEIASALGQEGVPIPGDDKERLQVAQEFLRRQASLMPRPKQQAAAATNHCLGRVLEFSRQRADQWEPGRASSAPLSITPPTAIPLSVFEVVYPATAIDAETEGTVRVEIKVLEDGGVVDVRLLDPPLGSQLEASAGGALSLRFYTPGRMFGSCGVPVIVMHSVRYHLQ